MSTSSGAPPKNTVEENSRAISEAVAQEESMQEYLWVMTRVPELFIATYAAHDCPELADFQIEMLETARNVRRSCILVPKGHGKSTLMAKWLPILEMCANPNVRIILICKNDQEGKAYSENIRQELEHNEKLIEDFGEFRSSSWSRDFNIKQRQINDPHKTLEVYGWNGRYLGHRCDLLIADDIVDDRNAETAEQREKLIERFRAAAQTGPQYKWPFYNPECDWEESSANLKVPEGLYWPKDINYERVVVCGTRFHAHDLYRKLAGDMNLKGGDPTFRAVYFDCWKDSEQTQPLWPAVWTKAKLEAERDSLGPTAYNRRYRNRAVDQADLAFAEAWILGGEMGGEEFRGCVNRDRTLKEYPDGLYKILGFDPASGSTGKYASAPSFMLLGYDKEAEEGKRKRYVIDLFDYRTKDIDDLIDVFLDGNPRKNIPGFRKLHDYDMAVIETNAYGTFFANHRRLKEAETRGLLVREHWTQGNKTDPIDGILTMQGIFKQGLVDIPYGDEYTRRRVDKFIEQLLEFPHGWSDFLLAFWFAELWIRKNTQAQGVVTRNTPGKRFQTSNYWNRPSL